MTHFLTYVLLAVAGLLVLFIILPLIIKKKEKKTQAQSKTVNDTNYNIAPQDTENLPEESLRKGEGLLGRDIPTRGDFNNLSK